MANKTIFHLGRDKFQLTRGILSNVCSGDVHVTKKTADDILLQLTECRSYLLSKIHTQIQPQHKLSQNMSNMDKTPNSLLL